MCSSYNLSYCNDLDLSNVMWYLVLLYCVFCQMFWLNIALQVFCSFVIVYLCILSNVEPSVEYIVLLDTNELALRQPDNPQYICPFNIINIINIITIYIFT